MADIYVATTGNDTTGNGSSGNPYATPGKAMSVVAAGDTIWIKTGNYTCSSTANVAGGKIDVGSVASTDRSATVRIRGYGTTIGDSGKATLLAGAASMNVVRLAGYGHAENLIIDGNSNASVTAFWLDGTPGMVRLCRAQNCATGFSTNNSNLHAEFCEAYNCTTGFSGADGIAFACFADTCGTGFSSIKTVDRCIAIDCTTAGVLHAAGVVSNSTFYGNASGVWNYGVGAVVNCIFYGQTAYGIRENFRSLVILNCAFGSNTSGNLQSASVSLESGTVTLTADPFTNAAGDDFSLNNTAGGGADCRAAGIPGAFPGGTTTGYLDIGAVQHQDSGGGGGGVGSIFRSRIFS